VFTIAAKNFRKGIHCKVRKAGKGRHCRNRKLGKEIQLKERNISEFLVRYNVRCCKLIWFLN
jgi:hypothetical protein